MARVAKMSDRWFLPWPSRRPYRQNIRPLPDTEAPKQTSLSYSRLSRSLPVRRWPFVGRCHPRWNVAPDQAPADAAIPQPAETR